MMLRSILFVLASWYAALFFTSGSSEVSASDGHVSEGADSALPSGDAAWVYDVSRSHGEGRRYDPAYHANAINRFNRDALAKNRITTVYSYAGSLELYCPQGKPSHCDAEHMVVIYPLLADSKLKAQRREGTLPAYRKALEAESESDKPRLVPVIDGVINADYAGSLKGMSELNKQQAYAFADKLSRKLCADSDVAGVQLDLEPLSLAGRNGQYHFYQRIAENLAGEVPASGDQAAQACRNADYPQGRFFSVFASSNRLNPTSEEGNLLAKVLSSHGNGYLIAPLYDLGDGPAGEGLALGDYRQRAERHVAQMKRWAKHHGVSYQLAVPAAGTVHEFSRCAGERCSLAAGGASQLDYLSAALDAIGNHNIDQQPEYLGLAIWGWTRGVEHHGMRFYPATPKWSTVEALQKR